ncbi:hypothetical protein IMZ48_27180 [Candidatus Bathyarchaeota archaeon]|nr:hypothetical protein [Candidatus Bathyarchaeota archaeon]
MHVEPEKDAPSGKRMGHGHRDPAPRTRGLRISEIHASTMPRPPWWSPCDGDDAAESKDPDFVDTVLDTNVCFVDTPGHDSPFKVSHFPRMLFRHGRADQ